MKTSRIVISILVISAFLSVVSLDLSWAEPSKEVLKIMPASTQAATREDLVSAISNVAESTIPAVVLIQVTERREVTNPLLPFDPYIPILYPFLPESAY